MNNGQKKINNSLFIYVVLTISIFLNIFFLMRNYNYKYIVGEQSYVETENIRHKNEINMNIISNSIDSQSINNQDLLQIHKNYESISSSVIELWQQYSQYEKNSIFLFSKRVSNDKIIQNDVHSIIKEYTLSILDNEMQNEKTKIILENEDLECFKVMRDMSQELTQYFNLFNQEKLNDMSSELKKNKIIKNKYWIDILSGIDNITEEYVDTEWNMSLISS